MKRPISFIALFLAACGSLPLPFQPTVVNQYPTPLPTPTLAVQTKSIHAENVHFRG